MLKLSNFKKDPKTTIIGVIGAILTILVVTGIIPEEEAEVLRENLILIVSGVFSIIMLFIKTS